MIPSPNTLTIDNWSAPSSLWELSKKNINAAFAAEAKLKIQMSIHITRHDPVAVLQRARPPDTASIAECLIIILRTADGSDLPNVESAADLVMIVPTVTTNANRITMIETSAIRRNQKLMNRT
jgi:hypothetical protein